MCVGARSMTPFATAAKPWPSMSRASQRTAGVGIHCPKPRPFAEGSAGPVRGSHSTTRQPLSRARPDTNFDLHWCGLRHKVDGCLVVYLVIAMGLNIKNDETCQLAGKLARLTGDTMTGAITIALRERLEREQRVRGVEKRLEEMRLIAERCARLLAPGPSAVEHGDVLYDERGLPH